MKAGNICLTGFCLKFNAFAALSESPRGVCCMRNLFVLACLLTAALMVPAAAQDGSEAAGGRSASDAQRFLAQLLVRTPPIGMDYNLYRAGSQVSPVAFGGATVVPASGNIVGVESAGACQTRFALDQAQITQQEPGETENFRLGPGISESHFIIDWSKAGSTDLNFTSRVTRRDAKGQIIETFTEYPIKIGMQGGWQTIGFSLPNEDERTRLSLAIEVLRNACRFQSDTGF